MIFLRNETDIRLAARQIRLLILDVDGVLTNGQLYFGETGEVIKAFNTLDGHGIKLLQNHGIRVAIISGRRSIPLSLRAEALGINLIRQGREDKLAALAELLQDFPCSMNQVAMMGDDLPDLPVMLGCGLAITVPNGHDSVREYADVCTSRSGGEGAVREVADFLLRSQGQYEAILSSYNVTQAASGDQQ